MVGIISSTVVVEGNLLVIEDKGNGLVLYEIILDESTLVIDIFFEKTLSFGNVLLCGGVFVVVVVVVIFNILRPFEVEVEVAILLVLFLIGTSTVGNGLVFNVASSALGNNLLIYRRK